MSALVIKELKPATLRRDAFRPIFLNELRKAGRDIIADFKKTTATWDTDVKFEMQISLSGGLSVEVYTENKIYGYVDKGTKGPYPIFAGIFTGKSNKKALAFSSQFAPKTIPGVIGSSAGARGSIDTVRPYVTHPGIKAREFSREIEKKWQTIFKRRMEKALSEARKACGHAI
jgi:hypothetical protein